MSDKDVLIKTWVCGPLAANCYLVGSLEEKEVMLIDPGGCYEEVTEFMDQKGLVPKLIIATHGHLDHILAIPDLLKKWDVKVACHPEELQYFMNPDPMIRGFIGQGFKPFKPEHILEDGDKIQVGPYSMEVIHTPGHSPGSICLLCPPFLFSGDTLFKAGVGRTDFDGGDYNALVRSLKNRLWPLSDDLILLPGHGDTSVLGEEKRFGFF
jgi:glyoxylase-like metal-dependent hydrolase (beta-lactamase superfamily II)